MECGCQRSEATMTNCESTEGLIFRGFCGLDGWERTDKWCPLQESNLQLALGGARYIHLTKRTMRHEYTRNGLRGKYAAARLLKPSPFMRVFIIFLNVFRTFCFLACFCLRLLLMSLRICA